MTPELESLIADLETRADMPAAAFEGALNALRYLIPGKVADDTTAQSIATTDGALIVADDAYPRWSVHIHGRAVDRDGNWHCTLRENDARDNDAAVGLGHSPILAQAILAAVLRLSMVLKKTDAAG